MLCPSIQLFETRWAAMLLMLNHLLSLHKDDNKWFTLFNDTDSLWPRFGQCVSQKYSHRPIFQGGGECPAQTLMVPSRFFLKKMWQPWGRVGHITVLVYGDYQQRTCMGWRMGHPPYFVLVGWAITPYITYNILL